MGAPLRILETSAILEKRINRHKSHMSTLVPTGMLNSVLLDWSLVPTTPRKRRGTRSQSTYVWSMNESVVDTTLIYSTADEHWVLVVVLRFLKYIISRYKTYYTGNHTPVIYVIISQFRSMCSLVHETRILSLTLSQYSSICHVNIAILGFHLIFVKYVIQYKYNTVLERIISGLQKTSRFGNH